MFTFQNKEFRFQFSSMEKIIACLLALNILSLLALFSALHQGGGFVDKTIFLKQFLWIIVAWISLLVFSCINYRVYFDFVFIIYAINILLLIAVYVFGRKAMGAQRWLSLGGFNFQPSELSKLSIIFLLARFFSLTNKQNIARNLIILLFLVILNALLIFKQPDLGTAFVIVLVFLITGFFSQIKKRYFVLLIVVSIVLAPFAWRHLKDYQKQRLTVFLNPNIDPLGAGYTIIQSKIAIGSGKIFGKGFLAGTQNQLNFLPERHTDFIFTVIAEEWGLSGCIFLLFLYWTIIYAILRKILEMKDSFAQVLSICISAYIFLHVFINIGMTLGILPVVGIPLIFISFGGSNLMISYILLGIFFNISRSTR